VPPSRGAKVVVDREPIRFVIGDRPFEVFRLFAGRAVTSSKFPGANTKAAYINQ